MAVRDNKTGRFVPFDSDLVPDRCASDVFDATRLKGKVYRRLIENVNVSDNEALPSERYVDVTSEYFGENEARVPVEREADDVCLGVFCNGSWHVIGKVSARATNTYSGTSSREYTMLRFRGIKMGMAHMLNAQTPLCCLMMEARVCLTAHRITWPR